MQAVVQDQVFQGAVHVVGLGKAVSVRRPVDHAVLHFLVHAAGNEKTAALLGCDRIRMEATSGWERPHSHNGAGVASLLAALPDQERPRIFPLEHLLRLRPAHLANEPVRLVLVRQVLLVSFQDVGTVGGGRGEGWNTGNTGSVNNNGGHSLVQAVALRPQPVIDAFLSHAFVVEPAARRSTKSHTLVLLLPSRSQGPVTRLT